MLSPLETVILLRLFFNVGWKIRKPSSLQQKRFCHNNFQKVLS